MSRRKRRDWIAAALNPADAGDLIAYIHQHYGDAGFRRGGDIRLAVLHQLSRGNDRTAHMADMALALRGRR